MSLVRLVPKRNPDAEIDRLWLVFFGEAVGEPWWARFLAPGYRHVVACAWFAEQERWIYFNPARTGTVILMYRDAEFDPRFQQLLRESSTIIRIASKHSRVATPFGWWCTGAIKALLGVRSCALSPHQLCRHLLRHGGVVVDRPARRSDDDQPVLSRTDQHRRRSRLVERWLGASRAGRC